MNMKLSFDPMKVTRGIFFYNDIEILHLPHYFFFLWVLKLLDRWNYLPARQILTMIFVDG